MSKKTHPPVPVNIITGSLGVGKTTAINQLLGQRPDGENWAVLVNEYGLVGLDAAILEDPTRENVEIKEVAGGCICCTAGFLFEMNLVLLLQRRPDRLLIEPTGLAELSGILQTLARPGICESVDLRSVICLLDPQSYAQDMHKPEVRDQVESADILLGTRADLASQDQVQCFEAWAAELFPPKRHVDMVQHGKIPVELLDLVNQDRAIAPLSAQSKTGRRHLLLDAAAEPSHPDQAGETHRAHGHSDGHGRAHEHRHGHEHCHEHANHRDHDHGHGHTHQDAHEHGHTCDHEHSHDHAHAKPQSPEVTRDNPMLEQSHRSSACISLGWICWKDLEFKSQELNSWLTGFAASKECMRVKACIRTLEGWKIFNLTGDAKEIRKTGPKRESRVELLFVPDATPDASALQAQLRSFAYESPE